MKLDNGDADADDEDVTEFNVGFNFENAFSKYSKLGGVTGVFEGAHIYLFIFYQSIFILNKIKREKKIKKLTDKLLTPGLLILLLLSGINGLPS